jgi:Sec-independent protein translocase protein TatA
VVVIGLFFFGKNKIIDWAKSIGQAKKAFNEGQTTTKK